MNIDSQIICQDASLTQVLSALEKAPVKLCVVVSPDGRVVRTVTDGDIRRALLAGHVLEDSIRTLPAKSPVTRTVGTARATLLADLRTHSVDVIVLVDDLERPVRLVSRTDLTDDLLLSPPHLGTAEAQYVQQAFDENWIAPAGPNLKAFEDALCAVSGRAHALALASGTAGLHLALRVLDVAPHDRVYVSDLTFVASVQPVLYERATPVLIDSEPVSWNMSPLALARALRKDAAAGTLPKAIIVVHLYGQSADMGPIVDIAESYGVPVIEDAAESLGATYGNRPSGSHGLISVFSFNGNKIITTSGGGAMVSDRGDLIDRARKLSTQGRDAAAHYQHSEIAYNYRMSNVLAGIGRGQLEVLSQRVAARRAIFDRYVAGLGDLPGLSFQQELLGSTSNRWLTVVSLDPDHVPLHPYQLMRRLQASRMESRPAWKPMQMQPLLQGAEFVPHTLDQAISPALFLTSLCLPSGSAMPTEAQDDVIALIRAALGKDMAA